MGEEIPLAVEVRGVRSQFGDQVVHDQLDLDVRQGEILCVIGGSGSGKTVLLRTMIGLLRPAAGQVKVLNQFVHDPNEKDQRRLEHRIGVLFQQGALFSSLTVAENIALPLIEHAKLTGREAARLAAVKIALVGLPALTADKFPADLSGGMIKRAALARAIALDPEVLFLDEPTAGLDPIGAAAFDRLIRTLRDALQLTVVVVTHDLDSLYAIADRVAVLADKKVLLNDTIQVVSSSSNAWVHDYFNGPRGRAAGQHASASNDFAFRAKD